MSQPIRINLRKLDTEATAAPISGYATQVQHVRELLATPGQQVMLQGKPGSGKTYVARTLLTDQSVTTNKNAYELDVQSLLPAIISGERLLPIVQALENVASQLTPAIVFIDDLHAIGLDDPLRFEIATQIIQAFIGAGNTVLATVSQSAVPNGFETTPFFSRTFQFVTLGDLSKNDAAAAVKTALVHQPSIDSAVVDTAITLARQYSGRALPGGAIRLLTQATQRAKQSKQSTITVHDIQSIVAEQTGVPLSQMTASEQIQLATLDTALARYVIGQPQALQAIAGTIQRSRLNLSDPRRPRGSFLLLGPSGVGKTETAKAISHTVFGSTNALVRLDMSEYADAHTAARLTGPPPGYVGYDAGGQLTNPIMARPYSLVLLDELEKAHRKVHDTFLQVLDDGRLTDSHGTLVDFRQTILVATSNVATHEIIAGASAGKNIQNPEFFDAVILPALLTNFRPEFINRFDAVLVYEPLSNAALLEIANLGLADIATRVADRGIQFAVPPATLSRWLTPFVNPLLGARPVRRMLREHIETPLAQFLLANPSVRNLTITGEEPWLA